MPEYLIPPDLQGPIELLLNRFRELLAEHTIIVSPDDAFTELGGMHAVEDAERLRLDLDDVLMDLSELVRRGLKARDVPMPDMVVDASRAYLDEDDKVHLRLEWLTRVPA